MGFLATLKNKLGIGGVKASLMVPAQAEKAVGEIQGKVILTTKSEQEIVDVTVEFKEKYSLGKGENKTTKEYVLGKVKLNGGYSIKPGEMKEVAFTLPFKLLKSDNDLLKEKGGVLGGLGKASAFMDGEKSVYVVEAVVDVKSAALDPRDSKTVKLV